MPAIFPFVCLMPVSTPLESTFEVWFFSFMWYSELSLGTPAARGAAFAAPPDGEAATPRLHTTNSSEAGTASATRPLRTRLPLFLSPCIHASRCIVAADPPAGTVLHAIRIL